MQKTISVFDEYLKLAPKKGTKKYKTLIHKPFGQISSKPTIQKQSTFHLIALTTPGTFSTPLEQLESLNALSTGPEVFS